MFRHLHREPGFYKRLFLLALPLILQNLITTSLGFVDTFMVGMLGQNELSAVTAANTPIYLLQIIILGLLSGLSVLASQYWGKGDTDSINRCMGVSLYAGLIIAVSVAAVLFFFPLHVMALVTNNDLLIELGAPYLRIVGLSYIFNTISSVYIGMQRSTENPAMGMIVFGISMLTNTGLNYILIFGKFGAPALGITGAAIATLTSRVLEFVIVAVYAPRYRRVPLMLRLLLRPGGAMARSFLKYATPVLVNEVLWGLGVSVMTAVMGHMAISTDMLAAHAIMGNIDKFSTVACFGIAGATAVIVGKRIGEGAGREEVYSLGCCLLTVSFGVGLVVSVCLAVLLPTVFIPYLYPLFHLEGLALEEFRRVLRPGGHFLYVVPGPDHLWELKQVLYDRPYPNEEKETPYEGFAYQSIVPVEGTITLPCQADIRALFQMTPYYWKTPKTGAKRLADLESLTTRISFRIHIFQKL